MLTLGVDIGSTTCKAVIMRNGAEIIAVKLLSLGTGTAAADSIYGSILQEARLSAEKIDRVIVTGYGRFMFAHAERQVSELSCHAKGVYYLLPGTRTIIDIGGQDAKVMRINEAGQLENFVMNEKCAAGTGRFLDVMASILNVPTSELGTISAHAAKPAKISSICTVFAESEVISQLSSGALISDVAAGIHQSVAQKVSTQVYRLGLREQLSMSGGVALNTGVVKALEQELNTQIYTHPMSQLAGAIGAAIIAYEDLSKST